MNTFIGNISHYLQNSALTALFFDAWLKSLAVLAVAGGLCFLLRRAAAATRHWIWFLPLATLPCLVLLTWEPSPWHRPLWSVSTGFNTGNQISLVLRLAPEGEAPDAAAPLPPPGAAAGAAGERLARANQAIAARFSTAWVELGLALWMAGALLALGYVLVGQVQLSRLARNGRLVQAADWELLLREACNSLRLRRPVRLLLSKDNPMPLTRGWWRPVVLLPGTAENWPIERRRVVLLHELAHAKRWDCLT